MKRAVEQLKQVLCDPMTGRTCFIGSEGDRQLAANALCDLDESLQATNDHSKMVSTLVKPGEDIIRELTPEKAHLWHMASAAMGEAGEIFDCVKKACIYGKPLDLEHLVEELGDLEFYLEGIRQTLQLDRGDILRANVAKLTKRYGAKLQYSNDAAIARADKHD